MAEAKGPRCPNHRVHLVDCHKGIGICPISSCRFTYEADEAEKTMKTKLDAMGKPYLEKDWKVVNIDGGDNG